MNKPEMTLEIQTLGGFGISVTGKSVAKDWPSETVKVFFCSLLSPLDLYFTWDRICRAMLGVPESLDSRRQLERNIIRPLNRFLLKEFGFNPLVEGRENIRIDLQQLHVDAYEFHRTALEGLRLVALGNNAAALEKLSRANAIHSGIYLPDMPGKIILNTRKDLESLYQAAAMANLTLVKSVGCHA
jgi:hypothetical protein